MEERSGIIQKDDKKHSEIIFVCNIKQSPGGGKYSECLSMSQS